jgi:hypothetical protein
MSLVPVGVPFFPAHPFLATNLIVIANMSAYNKVDKEIVDTKRQLAKALSCLTQLR